LFKGGFGKGNLSRSKPQSSRNNKYIKQQLAFFEMPSVIIFHIFILSTNEFLNESLHLTLEEAFFLR
jgi:hypothetical protein